MAEIGRALDLPEDKVRKIKDSAKRRLRRAFEVRDDCKYDRQSAATGFQ